MRRQAMLVLTSLFLMIAVVPWIVTSCTMEPLIPDELRLERSNFEATVEAGQSARMQEERDGASPFTVVPLGTIAVEDAPTPTPVLIVVSPTLEPSDEPISEKTEEVETLLNEDGPNLTETPDSAPASTVVKVQTSIAIETPIPTARIIIIRSEAEQPTALPVITETDALTATEAFTDIATIDLPLNMVSVEDRITEQALTEQIRRDAGDSTLSDLSITLSPDGVKANGAITFVGGFQQLLTVEGKFAVENQSLVAQIDSIYMGRLDVTDRYKNQLETGINSSLYRLLPQRYVQSFSLSQGEVLVFSQVKP